MGKFVDRDEDGIGNATLTATDSIITFKIDSTIRSVNASSGQEATSLMATSEHGEYIKIIALSKRYPKRIFHYMCSIRTTRPEMISQTR